METNNSRYRREVRREVDREMRTMTWAGLAAAAMLIAGFTVWEVASNPAYAPMDRYAAQHTAPTTTTGQGGSR